VPEALKGWKATQDLPDDTVVADYNAYIEKLPKAERPGVSDVKYYVGTMPAGAIFRNSTESSNSNNTI